MKKDSHVFSIQIGTNKIDFLDKIESYQILCEVLFEHLPNEIKVKALAQAAERIKFELKDMKDE